MDKEWTVPFVNYRIQYKQIGEEMLEAVRSVLERGDFILREDLERFEESFAQFLGVKYAIGVNSCTDAMRLSLRVAGMNNGQQDIKQVITSSHTFLATLDAIVDVGGEPILVDSGEDGNMNTELLSSGIAPFSKAIMPVHLNGRCCNMQDVMTFAKKHKLVIIEDAAQALGASYKGKKAGTWGISSCFSFFPAKVLGTVGNGGMVATNDREFATKIRWMRDYGRIKGQEQVAGYGYNSRLDNLHAAILNIKLKYLPQWIQRRRDIANQYDSYLRDIEEIKLPPSPIDSYMTDFYDVYQNYVIRVKAKDRDDLVSWLIGQDIEVMVSWRTPLHKQKALGLEHFKLPVTEQICSEVISLPMYPELTDNQVEYVCKKIKEYYRR